MHRNSRTTLAVLILSAPLAATAAAQDQKKPISAIINFIANEGLLLLYGEESGVMIDALFRESVEPYDKIPQATLDHMETAKAPFDQVKFVLVTHRHADHFSAPSVARFLRSNVAARLVTSQQVVDDVKSAAENYETIAERVMPVSPAGTEAATVEVDGIKIEVLALSHGSGHLAEVTNYGYIVHIGGRRLLHIGDAELNEANKAVLAKHAVGVEAACIPYWWFLEENGREFIVQTLKPLSAIAIHIPHADVEDIARKIRVHMPVVVFPNPWTSKQL